MLKNLFRPKWQHDNASIRMAALDKLTSADIAILKQLALADDDENIRLQAIAKIENLTILEELSLQAKNSSDAEFALKCWVSVLIHGGQLSSAQLDQFILDCNNEKQLTAIIAYADNDSLRDLALSGIKNEDQLLALMHSTKNARVWQTIIDKIVSEDALKKAQNFVKGRDKKSLQTIKHKLDQIKTLETQHQTKSQQAAHILEKLNGLLRLEHNPLFEGILVTCKQQFSELQSDFSEEQNQSITKAILQCEEKLAEQLQKKAQLLLEEQQITLDSEKHQELLTALLDINTFADSEDFATNELQEKVSDLFSQWQNLSHSADNKSQQLFTKTHDKILQSFADREALKSLKDQLDLLDVLDIKSLNANALNKHTQQLNNLLKNAAQLQSSEKSAFIAQIELQLKNARDCKHQIQEQSKKLSRNISQWLVEAEDSIEKKELLNSQKKMQQIEQALNQLSESDAKPYFNTFQRLTLALKTLEDWKNYATNIKREELCTQMEKVISDNNSPLEKSELIKRLNQEWKSLGHCNNQTLWQKFKTLADEAYLPCQQYFTEQKNLRLFNAQQRTIICEQLESFISTQDWSNADWKGIEKLQKAVQDEWNRFANIERQEQKNLNDRFFNALNILKNHITAQRKSNHSTMVELINKAKDLLGHENSQDALNEYQKLNEQWKNIGITFYKEQQQLWHEFKKAGDALYEKRQNLRQEEEKDRQDNFLKANIICEKILNLSKLDDVALSTSKQDFDALKADYKALGGLPKNAFKATQDQFHAVCDTYEKTMRGIGKRLWVKQLKDLEQTAQHWLTKEINGDTLTKTDISEHIPGKWLSSLQQRIDAKINTDNLEENARMLCIEMEMLAGIESPAEDSQLKMQMQMQKLKANFGQLKNSSTENNIEDLYLRWYAMPCWSKDIYVTLEKRFICAADKALQL